MVEFTDDDIEIQFRKFLKTLRAEKSMPYAVLTVKGDNQRFIYYDPALSLDVIIHSLKAHIAYLEDMKDKASLQ